jgi:hypothetical protein
VRALIAAFGVTALITTLPSVEARAAERAVAPQSVATVSAEERFVREALSDAGGALVQQRTAFLEAGRIVQLASVASEPTRCSVFVLLSTRNLSFSASLSGTKRPAEVALAQLRDATEGGTTTKNSENGLLLLHTCTEPNEAASEAGVLARMSSARGTVSALGTTVSRSLDVGDLERRLRSGLGLIDGPAPARIDLGPPLRAEPLTTRRARGSVRARAAGASNVLFSEGRSDAVGEGVAELVLTRGCHTVSVYGADGNAAQDVDAELVDAETAERIDRDRSELADAFLAVCVMRRRSVRVSWRGALPAQKVLLEDAVSAIGTGIPEAYGERAAAGFAALFHERETASPSVEPIFETMGAQGNVELTIDAEPGRCYLAAAALIRGASRGMRLVAGDAAKASLVEAQTGSEAGLVHFCTSSEKASLVVDVPGGSIAWVGGVWLVGAQTLGAAVQGEP